MSRAGIVTVAGIPNSGKSTLLNRIVGQKLSIVSPKPQSTREDPRYPLQHAMRATSLGALREADVIVHVVDATGRNLENPFALPRLDRQPTAPIIAALNKSDLLSTADRERLAAFAPGAEFISATTGAGIDQLLDRVRVLLPESPFLYPADEVSTQSVRFFVAELVRETALEQLNDEVPYSVVCEVEEFREAQSPVYIRAVLHVERESQKRILIGASGERIRSIGREARRKVEAMVGAAVYLDLWVKVLPNWRRDAGALRRFGYHLPGERLS